MSYRTQKEQGMTWVPDADPLRLQNSRQAASGPARPKFAERERGKSVSSCDNDTINAFVSNVTGLMGKLNTEIKHFRDSKGDRSGYDAVVREYEQYVNDPNHGIDQNNGLVIDPVFSGGYITDVRIVAKVRASDEEDDDSTSSPFSSSGTSDWAGQDVFT